MMLPVLSVPFGSTTIALCFATTGCLWVAIIGTGCSLASEAVAEVSQYYNLSLVYILCVVYSYCLWAIHERMGVYLNE